METISMVSLKLQKESIFRSESLDNSNKCVSFIKERFGDMAQEVVIVLYLDSKLHPVCISQIAKGSIDGCTCSPRDIFSTALLSNAKGIIIMHNHPSGDLKPSKDDIDITKRLVAGGVLMDVKVHDHIIFERESHYSMLENGTVNFDEFYSNEECVKMVAEACE